MYEDLPQRMVWHTLGKLMHGDTPAGRPTIGPKQNIKKFGRKDFVEYVDAHYIAEKTIVVVSGDLDQKKVVDEVKKSFKDIKRGKKINKAPVKEAQKAPALGIYNKKTDTAHMVMAVRTYPAKDKRLPALHVLSTILGAGMSSRLFHRLRDEMGACYYVRSVTEELTDHGVLAIATGIEPKRAEEVTKALIEECKKLSTTLVTNDELEKAKEFYSGHLYMGLETTDSLAEFYVSQEITTKKPQTPSEIEKDIRKVTPQAIREVAKDIFKNNKLNLAIVGDIRSTAGLKKILKF